jgi:hypothetical protein
MLWKNRDLDFCSRKLSKDTDTRGSLLFTKGTNEESLSS